MIYGTFKWNRKCLIIPVIFNRIFWNLVLTLSFDDINLLWKKLIERISESYWTDNSCIVSLAVIIVRHGIYPKCVIQFLWNFGWIYLSLFKYSWGIFSFLKLYHHFLQIFLDVLANERLGRHGEKNKLKKWI